jgi:hypothetical protein
MKRTPTFLQIVSLCLLAYAASAGAQPASNAANSAAAPASPPSAAPPKMEKLEEGEAVTITPKPGTEKKITEKREQGKVTEVKVQSGKSSYTMKPNVPAGNAVVGDAQSSAIRAPQWEVMEFDLGQKRKKQAEEAAAAAAPAPPPVAK